MAKKHEQDLRIVEGVVSAQLAKHDAEIAALRAQVAELTGKLTYNRNYAAAAFAQQRELIKALVAQVDEWERVGNAIMECATGKPGPLSDSDVCGEIAALRAQVETMIQAQAYAENTILRQRWMMDAQKRTASDAIAERDASIAKMERQLSGNLDAETNERIAQIMMRWTASTPGEWITTADTPDSTYYGEVVAVHNQDDPDYGTMSHVLTVPELDDRPNDLIFAAYAHQDIPFLVAVISEFSGRYSALRKHVDFLNDVHDRGQTFSRKRTGEMAAEIKMLRAQVAELEAWKAAVPVKSILWYFDVSEFSQAIVNYNTVTQMKHNTALEKWHRDMVEEVIDV